MNVKDKSHRRLDAKQVAGVGLKPMRGPAVPHSPTIARCDGLAKAMTTRALSAIPLESPHADTAIHEASRSG
jgi:hypothetical protein